MAAYRREDGKLPALVGWLPVHWDQPQAQEYGRTFSCYITSASCKAVTWHWIIEAHGTAWLYCFAPGIDSVQVTDSHWHITSVLTCSTCGVCTIDWSQSFTCVSLQSLATQYCAEVLIPCSKEYIHGKWCEDYQYDKCHIMDMVTSWGWNPFFQLCC